MIHMSPRHLLAPLLLAALAAACLCGCPRGNDHEELQVTVTDEGGGEARETPGEEQLLALARREGEVNWYTSITADQATAFARKFEARYPGVRVRLVREGTFDLIERVQHEITTGQARADVLHVLDPAVFVALRQRGELYYYGAPEATAVAPEYKDPGYWTAARLVTIGLAYAPARLAPAQAPQRWEQLTDGRWKGKLGLKDAQTAGSAYAQYYFLRELYGVSYWQRIAALKPRIYKTEEDMMGAVASGEVLIAAGVMISRLPGEPDGAPRVDTVWPTDGVPLMIAPVAILNRAPHLSAARLFMNYTLSAEGQTALRDLAGAYPARGDVAAPQGSPPLKSLPLLQPASGWTEYLNKQGALRAEYTRLFHGEGE
jgi:iron(III) transport system substrate-binding protein